MKYVKKFFRRKTTVVMASIPFSLEKTMYQNMVMWINIKETGKDI